MIEDLVKSERIIALAKEGKREDERALDAYRNITIERDVVSSAEGSAKVRLGQTQVLAGVKIDLSVPFRDKPDEGTLSVIAELLPLASPTFEPGPPNENSIELARVVDRGIRSSEAIDLKSLFIEEEKVWGVFIDLYVLNHDGNLIDASGLAAVAALKGLKLPRYEDGKVVREYKEKINLKEIPTYSTFAKINGRIFLDPSYNEEVAMDSRLTIATTESEICAIQKAGVEPIKREEILNAINLSFEKGKELRKII